MEERKYYILKIEGEIMLNDKAIIFKIFLFSFLFPLLGSCSSYKFTPIEENIKSIRREISKEDIKIVDIEDLESSFLILGNISVKFEKFFSEENPDIINEGVLKLKEKASKLGGEGLLNIFYSYNINPLPTILEPIGRYKLKMEMNALLILFKENNNISKFDRNGDKKTDLWLYSLNEKLYYEFNDEDMDGKIDLQREYLYKNKSDIQLEYIPKPKHKNTDDVDTSLYINSQFGYWTNLIDINKDGKIDIESSVYTRINRSSLVIEKILTNVKIPIY